ncbi:MAG: hypothetical protein K2K48_02270 [Anaeroplasmataceae bacterium]|nr:hypothetical protein [Anaeroplasmataceae bacterium]
MKKFLISVCFLFYVFLFSSCKSKQNVEIPNIYFPIELESKYNLDEDINIKISIGLDKYDQKRYCQIEDMHYSLAYSPMNPNANNVFSCEDTVILYTITDFNNDIYYYNYINNEYNFNFCETFTIKKEIFTQDSGEFYIFLGGWGFIIHKRIIYEKKEGSLYLQEKYIFDR